MTLAEARRHMAVERERLKADGLAVAGGYQHADGLLADLDSLR